MEEIKLTIKQKKFADEYIISGNATESALKAGYKNGVSGRENLQKPTIKAYIEARMKELEDEAIAKQDEVLKYLTSVMRGEHTEQTVIGAGDGYQEITDIEVSAKDRIKAAELLGKRYGTFTDKVDMTNDIVIITGESDLVD